MVDLDDHVKDSSLVKDMEGSDKEDNSNDKSNHNDKQNDKHDQGEPVVVNETVKVRRESAQRARGVIQTITNKPSKQHTQKIPKQQKIENKEKKVENVEIDQNDE